MEGTFLWFMGTKVATFYGPVLASARMLGNKGKLTQLYDTLGHAGQPGGISYKQGDKNIVPGYSAPMPHPNKDDQGYIRYRSDVRPKYNPMPTDGSTSNVWGVANYTPMYLREHNRSKYTDELKHTFNNVDGSTHSINFYEDNKRLKQQLVDGEWTLVKNDHRQSHSITPYMLKPHKQVTATRLLETNVDAGGCRATAAFNKKQYGLTSEEYIALGRSGFKALKNRRHPGWRAARGGLGREIQSAGTMGASANQNVTIKRIKNMTPNLETPMHDKGFLAIWDAPSDDAYKIDAPFPGNGRNPLLPNYQMLGGGDSLAGQRNFMQGYITTASGPSFSGNPMMGYQTQFDAIADLEGFGVNWSVDFVDYGVNSWPVNRHRLYTDNFPYRGMVKKPVSSAGKWKRHKGGDAPQVLRREDHPSTIDHFESKTKEELFA
eukprot:TRINITY_DN32059_c0_g1_i1.p1 TRINITY_DN32059_c0_g1~~TRINITY_DN32059_c0_g1_i1.p1  ORF type:complete len:434 (+),score=93.67 TRINITY_DN32059_c0_g1_i1:80-1381(+)